MFWWWARNGLITRAVKNGALTKAIKSLRPVKNTGPWRVLCDNEHFLTSKDAQKAHKKAKIVLWKIPPKSPDLNPIERFWSWLRRKLRAMDLNDLVQKRPALGKAAYKARVIRVLKTRAAQKAASRIALGFQRACKEVVAKKSAGIHG